MPLSPLTLVDVPLPVQLNSRRWASALAYYPDQKAAALALHGIIYGVRVRYCGSTDPSMDRVCHNLSSAIDHAQAVTADIDKEVKAGRIAGPFPTPPARPFIASPLGTVPKKGTDEVRRIHHLSYPRGESVNESIADQPLSYASFDHAVEMVLRLGRRALLAKIDVKAAFRCIAVHPLDRWLFGMIWEEQFYADLALPFGSKSSPALWERYAFLAEWILRQNGVKDVIHYVDDYLVGGASGSDECKRAVETTVRVFDELGIPISHAKFVAEATPSQVVVFLGIMIDTGKWKRGSTPSDSHGLTQCWMSGPNTNTARADSLNPSSAPLTTQRR